MHLAALHRVFDLEKRVATAQAESLGFVRESYNAAVVVAQHGHRLPLQARIEYALARHEKIIAVYQPYH